MNNLNSINPVYSEIKNILENSRKNVVRTVNSVMVRAYWNIGRIIVEEEQRGENRAEYGAYLIKELSKRLTKDFSRGFDERNIWFMRQFYLKFKNVNAVRSESQKGDTLRHELTWTHYRLLLKLEDENARNFYINEIISNNWSTREFERQINSLLFERLSLSKDKNKIKKLASKGQIINKPEDLIKDPYVLEFLGIPENSDYIEKDLENILISKLQRFLLELGKGFSFVARQKRITLDNDHYYIDLVFYNYILKCFFLIDLKVGKLTHADIGQMDFYVRYFEDNFKQKKDNATIGLILCSDKNNLMVKYTMLSDNKNIFASKYKLYIPTKKELKRGLL